MYKLEPKARVCISDTTRTTPPRQQQFRETFLLYLVKILGKVGQNMTTPPPPPNVDVITTSLTICKGETAAHILY